MFTLKLIIVCCFLCKGEIFMKPKYDCWPMAKKWRRKLGGGGWRKFQFIPNDVASGLSHTHTLSSTHVNRHTHGHARALSLFLSLSLSHTHTPHTLAIAKHSFRSTPFRRTKVFFPLIKSQLSPILENEVRSVS